MRVYLADLFLQLNLTSALWLKDLRHTEHIAFCRAGPVDVTFAAGTPCPLSPGAVSSNGAIGRIAIFLVPGVWVAYVACA